MEILRLLISYTFGIANNHMNQYLEYIFLAIDTGVQVPQMAFWSTHRPSAILDMYQG